MKKRFMAILLIATMVMPVSVAGCGKKKKTENTPATMVDSTTKQTEETSEDTSKTEETERERETENETETSTEGTVAPTVAPTQPATQAQTAAPTAAPTQPATQAPTAAPTQPATQAPTVAPTQPATQAPTAAPTQPSTQKQTQAPTVAPTQPSTQPQTQAPTTAAPTQAQTQPTTTKEKTIWDYPFSHEDLEAIKAQCIKWGEEIGLKHVTGVAEEDGCEWCTGPAYEEWAVYTPENTSWNLPIDICEEWCGEKAKNKFEEWVKKQPEIIITYGGRQIRYFTIWYEEFDNGNIVFYFLY